MDEMLFRQRLKSIEHGLRYRDDDGKTITQHVVWDRAQGRAYMSDGAPVLQNLQATVCLFTGVPPADQLVGVVDYVNVLDGYMSATFHIAKGVKHSIRLSAHNTEWVGN